jgi:hypothetical protein
MSSKLIKKTEKQPELYTSELKNRYLDRSTAGLWRNPNTDF